MKLFFSGAAHEVTGSKHYLEAAGKKILIDCGMEQGKNLYENQEIPVPASDVDYVFLTHAHIDHSGMLPLLYNQGFKGSVYTTEATQQLCQIMLLDSAHIQEFEAEWKNRKGKRAGIPPIVPIYTTEDAVGILQYFVPCRYEEKIQVCDGIEIRFVDAGHLLGSASIEVWVTEQGVTKKLVFSGDIGNTNQPIIKDPQYIREADYVIMESTYGDRSHGPRPDYIRELTATILTSQMKIYISFPLKNGMRKEAMKLDAYFYHKNREVYDRVKNPAVLFLRKTRYAAFPLAVLAFKGRRDSY